MLKQQKFNENIITFYGSIGDDERGRYMTKDLYENGINARIEKVDKEVTSACAILVHQKERTMCCDLAAAKSYSFDHMKANMDAMSDAKIIYTTSYFMFSSFDIMMHALNFALEKRIPVGFNLSAEYTILFEFEKIKQSIEFSDFVFANEHEAAAYGKKEGISDLKEVAMKIASHKKLNNKPRVAIITQGANPVIVAIWNPETKDLKVNHYEV